MDIRQQRKAAEEFATKWKGRGYEKGETAPFWLEFLRECLFVKDPDSIARFEKRTDAGFPDVTIEDSGVIIEQKSIDVDLDKPGIRQKREVTPYQQALSYAQSLPPSQSPRFIITCNFKTFRIYDREDDQSGNTFVQVELEELAEQIQVFNFIVDPENSRIERERKVSIKAGELIGELHHKLQTQYKDPESTESQHSLNMLCVRLVFLMFAEDAGLFEKNLFYDYFKGIPAGQGAFRRALLELFEVLNTPVEDRDNYIGEMLSSFPYVNGGLFEEKIEIPVFTDDIKYHLLQKTSYGFDWSVISPVVFGGVFESTLNPETRAKGGMHYTSVENIHKVIDPLFLDALEAEFEDIIAAGHAKKTKEQKLRDFQTKLAELNFLDPACGSGNFLTETYLCLRRLENRILIQLQGSQGALGLEGVSDVKVSLSQFYGIEINDFAVHVARAALWIAELQANIESEGIIQRNIEDFPLCSAASIAEANALTLDWNVLLPAEQCNFIMGNPPFLGQARQSREQSDEVSELFPGNKSAGKLDYVAGWYSKATDYTLGTDIRVAFVSSNSICQGESVSILWKDLFNRGMEIGFAHLPFLWNSEAANQAHVFVVIVCLSNSWCGRKTIYGSGKADVASNINGYLKDAPSVFIENRSKAIGAARMKVVQGSQPMEDGRLLFTREEKELFVLRNPETKNMFKVFMGSREFLNDIEPTRYCLWLDGVDVSLYKDNKEIVERLNHIVDYRKANKIPRIRATSDKPQLFTQIRQPENEYLLIPRVSSERRQYLPMGFMSPEIIAGDAAVIGIGSTLYDFGLLSSSVHNSWIKTVAGRLKSDIRYSPSVYYNFPYPEENGVTRTAIEEAAKDLLDVRSNYKGVSLAELYNPDKKWAYQDLYKVHSVLSKRVEDAYGVDFDGESEKIVAHLFKLYSAAVSPDKP